MLVWAKLFIMKNVYLASLDPMHFSHWNTWKEAEKLLQEKVFLCICQNSLKDQGRFTLNERADFANKFFNVPKEQIVILSKKESIVSAIKNATNIIRGIRSEKDIIEIQKLVEHYGVLEDCKKLIAINVPENLKIISSSALIEKIKVNNYNPNENWIPKEMFNLIKERF